MYVHRQNKGILRQLRGKVGTRTRTCYVVPTMKFIGRLV